MSKRKEVNKRNFMMRWMSKKARTDPASSSVLAQPVDDKEVFESASKMKMTAFSTGVVFKSEAAVN